MVDEEVDEMLVQQFVEMIGSYLQRLSMKERRARLRAFKRALDIVSRKWSLLDW